MRDYDIRPVLKARLDKTFQRMPSLIVDELGFNEHCATHRSCSSELRSSWL